MLGATMFDQVGLTVARRRFAPIIKSPHRHALPDRGAQSPGGTVWKYRFAPRRSGRYRVRLCATDGSGHSQPVSDAEPQTGMSAQPRVELAVTMS
jgi:hypothetical protein